MLSTCGFFWVVGDAREDNDLLLNVEGQSVSSRLLIEILPHFIPNSSVANDRDSGHCWWQLRLSPSEMDWEFENKKRQFLFSASPFRRDISKLFDQCYSKGHFLNLAPQINVSRE